MRDRQEKPRWLDSSRNVDRLVHALWVICAALVVADFFYQKHPHFGIDGWFAFSAVFGFIAYCFVVFTAKALRRLVARREDYYDDDRPLGTSNDPAEAHDDEH